MSKYRLKKGKLGVAAVKAAEKMEKNSQIPFLKKMRIIPPDIL